VVVAVAAAWMGLRFNPNNTTTARALITAILVIARRDVLPLAVQGSLLARRSICPRWHSV